MLWRDLFALSLSLLLSGGSLAGVARAFEWHKSPPPPPPIHDPAYVELLPVAVGEVWDDAPGADRPCPADRVDWPAIRLSSPRAPFVSGARFSPAYCVLIGANGRTLDVRLAGGSGSDDADRALGSLVRLTRFRAAYRQGQPVAAWHRLTVSLRGRPYVLTGVINRGPELTFDATSELIY